MKRRTKIISAVMALAILVCVFAVLATSFAVDTSSESASFRVDAQIMGYNRVEVKYMFGRLLAAAIHLNMIPSI